eukprot:CAMPEP_0203667368 /NCGR_PEP_ID=MMETSP0090-20130426/4209_1 /ASSEMBLY_ACC=CAM_ASM_001088 /TAXON_ID=426623 /ORGANISM="Chaetoceros affinis, Strain CCMP159" /LENGTH=1488 /DNA_ID=CAMNT_0050531501 /DNA_START=87 /DNA_END=4553 /DNA_ORIENTATION=+
MTAESAANTAAAGPATEELYHTNLLRLQAKQLLSESILPLSSQTGFLDEEVKWTKDVQDYLEVVQKTICTIDAAVLSPDDVVMNKKGAACASTSSDGKGKNKHPKKQKEQQQTQQQRTCWIQLHSDKAKKHFEKKEDSADKNGDSNQQQQQQHKWQIHFPGGDYLQTSCINSYAANGAGLTTATANANVIPTLDLAVLLPAQSRNSSNDDEEEDASGVMIGGKDYLNGRYFDKRNIFAIHLAKYLSQKKQRKHIGSVHVLNELDGDYRKVSLILTPPIPDDGSSETKKNSTKKRKNCESTSNDDAQQDKKKKKDKKKKIRFRIRLVFGVQFDLSSRKKVDCNTGGWIPSARLFPNRCNNKIVQLPDQEGVANNNGTPNYNNALADDMHHLSSTQILSSVSSVALKVFTETWTLLKIWCLQRGFLRGHDTFSEKSLGLSLAYLYRSKLVSVRMDSIQVFTVWMKLMSDTDWMGDKEKLAKKKSTDVNKDNIRHSSSEAYQDLGISSTPGQVSRGGIVMPEINLNEQQTILNCVQNRLHASDVKKNANNDDGTTKPKTLLESFKMNTDSPIFLDPTMTVNYFANISPCFMREMQVEATKALKCIHFHGDSSISRIEPFRQLFLEQQRFWRRYDAYVKMDIKDIAFYSNTELKTNLKELEFWGDDAQDLGAYSAISRGIAKLLRMALGDRITALRLLTTGNGDTTNMLNASSTEFGTRTMVDSDEKVFVPIRSTSNSPYTGFDGSIVSPVTDGVCQVKTITVGLRINPDTCHRFVDRGPPADDLESSSAFVSLWGERKAQLRRFKDGAIIHAVVWNDVEHDLKNGRVQFEGGAKAGDIVERIVRHIFWKHFCKLDTEDLPCPQFALRNITSLVETVQKGSNGEKQVNSSEQAQKEIKSAFDSLVGFLRQNTEVSETPSGISVSKLGLPLRIDAVEALSPCLRYSELFPPAPHPLLGGENSSSTSKKVSGAIVGEPILIQIRFQGSSKWPQDMNAMGAAKCAMLMQLAEGIENMKSRGDAACSQFDGPMNVMPTYLDLGYKGYSFRIIVRADEEMKMLNSLRNPSQEALALKQILQKRHILSAGHHFTIHGVHTKHPSSPQVVRLIKRWLAAHMLSGLIPGEAVELLVASVYIDPAPLFTPTTVSCGFMRCLHLLFSHDWLREPLIVDPEGHIGPDQRSDILSSFERSRGPELKTGPPMFIISPNDLNEDGDNGSSSSSSCRPSFTVHHPERVVLGRICALARRSYDFLMSSSVRNLKSAQDHNSWRSIFQESSNSLKSYSILLRVDNELIYDTECASTGGDLTLSTKAEKIATPFQRSLEKRSLGPKSLRRKLYKNLASSDSGVIYSWNPVNEVVARLRSELGHLAVFFYNEYTPDVIGCLWRPDAFKGQSFSAMYSEYKRPIDNQWEENSLVITNASDVMRVIKSIVQDVVVDVKILDDRSIKSKSSDEGGTKDKNGSGKKGLSGSKRGRSKQDTSSDSDDDSSSDEDSD